MHARVYAHTQICEQMLFIKNLTNGFSQTDMLKYWESLN